MITHTSDLHQIPSQNNTKWKLQIITRAASWAPDHRKWLFSVVSGGIWTSHLPVQIKISADKRPLNQLTIKKIFFSLIIKTFCNYHQCIVHKKQLIWVFEWINLHTIPSIIQVGYPTCCYHVCALDHAKGGGGVLHTWITAQSPAIVINV